MALALALIWAASAPVGNGSPACDPRVDGAVGDGVAADTIALQATLDRCVGGTVRVAPGTYRIGPIALPSRTTLELAAGATLLASGTAGDYTLPNGQRRALVSASDVTNVAIVGAGTIDGAGAPWWEQFRADTEAGRAP
ncbi:MAG: hypothetical protein QOF51_1735, partial [Chloroflexota bacterium]|nr:hypothetical protein [Chloroflexota bacterium]